MSQCPGRRDKDSNVTVAAILANDNVVIFANVNEFCYPFHVMLKLFSVLKVQGKEQLLTKDAS